MHLFLVYGSDAHKQIHTATTGNEPEEARKLAQSVEQANRIVESWLLSKGGRFIAYEGGNGSAEIDAEHLGELKEILEQFSKAIKEGRVWAGVGTELKEADVAAQVAYRRGGENTVVLYTPEIAKELEVEDDEEELASDDVLLDSLNKFDQQAAPGEATAVERGQAAPPSPMSVASQGASQLPDIPGQENRPEGPTAAPGQPQNTQQLKQAIVGVLKDIRSQVPFFEQVKEQNPAAYEAVMGLVEAMLALAQQVMGPQAPTPQEAGLGKAEIVAKYLLDKNPQLALKIASLAKSLRPRAQGSGHFHGPLEFFDAGAGLGKEELEGEQHQFEEVPPEEYEKLISSRADQGGLAQDRDYTGKKTYVNKQRTAGVTVDPRTGELQYLFSLAKGHGVPAMRFGIKMGGTNLDCFDGGLVKLYAKHGWRETRREANWTPGGPDVVFMKYQPEAPEGVEPPLRRSEKLAKMAKIHDNPAKPMMVWRVQNTKGEGPYVTGADIQDDTAGNAPDPIEDFTDQDQSESGYNPDDAGMVDWFEGRASARTNQGPRFAFLKPEDANEWFGGDNLKRLATQGFNLVQVPAARVWRSESGKQVMYHPPVTKKNEELDPSKPPPKGTKLLKEDHLDKATDYNAWQKPDLGEEEGEFRRFADETGLPLSHILDSAKQGSLGPVSADLLNSGGMDNYSGEPNLTFRNAAKYATQYGKDWRRVAEGFRSKAPMPAPIVIHRDGHPPHLLAGNTRTMFAHAMQAPVQAYHVRLPGVSKGERDALPGGLADKSDPKQFPRDLLMEGAKHEMEHTDDPRIATEIAMDHLKEDPLYYRKLKAAGLDKGELAKKGLLAAMSAAGTKDSRKGDIAKPTPVFKDEPNPTARHNLQLPVGTVLNGTGRQGGGAASAKAGIVIETNADGKKVHRQQRRGRRAATVLEGGGSESAQNTPPPTDQPGPTEKKGTATGDGQG